MRAQRFERPRDALLATMMLRGLFKPMAKLFYEKRKAESLGFQYVAVEMLVREYNIVRDLGGRGSPIAEETFRGKKFVLLSPEGSERSDSVVARSVPPAGAAITWKDVLDLLPSPPLPLFVIDLSVLALRGEGEDFLKVQLQESLERVREYLWDAHLAITSSDRSIIEWLNMIAGKNKVMVTQSRPSELLWSMDANKVIVLRQDAPYALTATDVLTAEAFLIGLPNDRALRQTFGRVFDNLVPWGLPRRIELRGSAAGVPDSINKMIEIILKARYKYDGDLEKAVVTSMSQRNIMTRLYYELSKRVKSDEHGPYIDWESYHELSEWLPITKESFEKTAEKVGARLK